jgi:hypothetical protein
MTVRHARCSCGQLKIETSGEPVRISVCHCLACQRRTGSAFGAQARFPKANTRLEGRASQYVRIADSGKTITYQFCPECGSTVLYQLQDLPDLVAVPIGAFADPGFPAPKITVYESRQHGWVKLEVP